MILGTVVLRTISTVLFCHALFQIWQGVKGKHHLDVGQKQSNCRLILHLAFLIIYISFDVASLYGLSRHTELTQKNINIDIKMILWKVSGTANYILMIIVVEMLNSSYQTIIDSYVTILDSFVDIDASTSAQVPATPNDDAQLPKKLSSPTIRPNSRPTSKPTSSSASRVSTDSSAGK